MTVGIIFGVLTLMLLLPDCYVVFCVLRKANWLWKSLFLLPTVIYIALSIRVFFVADLKQFLFNSVLWITLCWVFPLLIFTLVSLLGRGVSLIWPGTAGVFNWIALGIAGIWFLGALYGCVFGWKKITVEPVEMKFASLPEAFDGFRIVQLTDFHIGTYGSSPKTVERIVEKVNSLKPDLIVFTGDIVNTSPDELEPFINTLKNLKAPYGVVSVLGNHDYCMYGRQTNGDTPQKALSRLVEMEKKMGWKLLRNQSVQIVKGNDSIAVVGVENAGSRSFIDRSDLKGATKDLPRDEFKILLSHDPTHWRREVVPHSSIPLMLAGHTHAMQFRLFGWSPSQWTYPEWGGEYREGDQTLYVSTGIGENVAFRFGAYPQIVLLTLNR